jgi:hypothetical protein
MSIDVSEVRAASIIRVMSDIQLRTRQYVPEDSELHTCRRENLESHILNHNVQLHLWKILLKQEPIPIHNKTVLIKTITVNMFQNMHVHYFYYNLQ